PPSVGCAVPESRARRRKESAMTTTTPTAATSVPYADLVGSLRGSLVLRGDAGYDTARAGYNGMTDKHPVGSVGCRDAADVVSAVQFANTHGLRIAVRGGGHNAGGLGVADDALVIDLSEMHSVTVDPGHRTVRADGGCTWRDVDHATVGFGMAT